MTDYAGIAWLSTAGDGGPSASYSEPMGAGPHRWMSLDGVFEREPIRPHFVAVDNLNSRQVLALDFGGIDYPVVGLSRLSFRVNPRATMCRVRLITGTAGNAVIVFATFDMSKLDQVNFAGLTAGPVSTFVISSFASAQIVTGPGTINGLSIVGGAAGDTVTLYDSATTNINPIYTGDASASRDIPLYGLAFSTGLRVALNGSGTAPSVTVFYEIAVTGGPLTF